MLRQRLLHLLDFHLPATEITVKPNNFNGSKSYPCGL